METLHPIIVQKYGGSSVATSDKIKFVAKLICERAKHGERLCIVVSAMGKTTDQLLSLAHEVSPNPPRRELDMLLSCGERASMALLAMALEEQGCKAVSLTGSQSGIITSDVHSGAKIIEVRPERVKSELAKGRVVIVAGFQGISVHREITTLGRGGSDTTAVALAAALGAEACEIYSDVPGVLTADPRWVDEAVVLPTISLEEMEELSLFGAKVMHAQAVQFARAEGVTITARQTGNDKRIGTLIAPERVNEKLSTIMVSFKDPVFHVSVKEESELNRLLDGFLRCDISHVQIYGWSDDKENRWHCLIHPDDAHGFAYLNQEMPFARREPDCSTASLVGAGLCETPRITARALALLRENQFHLTGILSAPNRSTFVLASGEGVRAMQLLHKELIAVL